MGVIVNDKTLLQCMVDGAIGGAFGASRALHNVLRSVSSSHEPYEAPAHLNGQRVEVRFEVHHPVGNDWMDLGASVSVWPAAGASARLAVLRRQR